MSAETDENVKVLYDFTFSDDTGQVEIKAGDVYRLVEKTNNEWWEVYDPSDVNGEYFFVPAQYVKTEPSKNHTYLNKTVASESLKYASDSNDEEEHTEDSDLKRLDNVIKKGSCGESDVRNDSDYVNVTCQAHSIQVGGDYVNLDQYRDAAGIKNVVPEDISEPNERNPPPRKWIKPPKVPVELIQRTAAPPVPENGKFVRVLAKDQPWDIYKENASGRLFYVNRETGEGMRTPPRNLNNISSSQSSLPAATSSAQVREEQSGAPVEHDWTQENGTSYLVHKGTQDKWKNLAGKVGLHYFHKMGGSVTRRTISSTSEVLEKENVSQNIDPSVQNRSHSPTQILNPPRPTNLTTSNSTGSLNPQTSEDVIEGYLYKTKVLDISKKKVKKSWAQIYVILQGSNIVFYKDQKSAMQKYGSPHGKPEAVVSLQGAHVVLNPKDLTSKRNTISLRVTAGNIYLFQSESEKDNLEWFTRMKIVANDISSEADSSPKDVDAQEVRKEKGMISSVTVDDNTNLPNIDRTRNMIRIRAKLFNLISRRPTQEDLYKRGIIRDAVFGSRLHELCDREQVNVPNFVHKCIAAVESKGITHDGLYRISGNMAEIQRLRCTVDTDDTYNLYDGQWDINVLTGALKLFFRELKEPIFTFRMYDRFTDAIKKESKKERFAAFKSAVSDLPRCNHATLKELFHHLRKVVDASHRNRMQGQNIAIVFGPTLMWQLETVEGLTAQMLCQNKVVEFVLQEYTDLFQ